MGRERGEPHPVLPPPLLVQLRPETPAHTLASGDAPAPATTCGSSLPTNMPKYSLPALRPGPPNTQPPRWAATHTS